MWARLAAPADVALSAGDVAPAAFATAAAVVALLAAEACGSRAGRWATKPLASFGFLAAALAAGAARSAYGRCVLAAQALGWAGDVLLMFQSERAFLAGLLAFLAGHAAYIAAIFELGMDWQSAATGGAVVAPLALAIAAWLRPAVRGVMRGAVAAYIAVISAMVAAAAGAAPRCEGRAAGALLLGGAAAFMASDLCVARERFVRRALANRLVGLPLYYAAQLALAASVAGCGA
eukprot:scaffold9.g3146.t1